MSAGLGSTIGGERGQQIEARGGEGRREAEQKRCQDGNRRGEAGNAPVRIDGQMPALRPDQRARTPPGDRSGSQRAKHGEQRAFREQVADEAPAACPQGQAHADFMSARGGASQQQVGQVAAGNQENGRRYAYQDIKRMRGLGVQLRQELIGGLELHLVIGMLRGAHVQVGKLPVECGESGGGSRRGDAGAEARSDLQPGERGGVAPVGGGDQGLNAHGQPHIGRIAGGVAEKRGRHDSDDGQQRAVDLESGTNGGRACEFALPESMTDYGDGCDGMLVGIGEGAAAAGGDAQHLEIIAADDGGVHRFDGAASAQNGIVQRFVAGGEHARDHLLAGRHLAIEGIAEAERLPVFPQLNIDELLAVSDRQRAKDHRVQHLVNGGVGADSECEREDGGGGEAGALAQLPERIAEVLRQCVEQRQAPLVAMRLAHLRDGAEIAASLGAGGGGGETAAFQVGRKHVEVSGNLFVEARGSAEQAAQARPQDAQGGHDSPSRSRLTMATVRDQLLASAANWRRPAAVME